MQHWADRLDKLRTGSAKADLRGGPRRATARLVAVHPSSLARSQGYAGCVNLPAMPAPQDGGVRLWFRFNPKSSRYSGRNRKKRGDVTQIKHQLHPGLYELVLSVLFAWKGA
jgi:hypothetical protein